MRNPHDAAPETAPTQTAVIVPVPEADPVVEEHRQRLASAAALGVPAHVTVHYPFLPPEAIDKASVAALAMAVASVGAFDCTFATTSWFELDVLWLVPDPAEPLRRLTSAVWTAFPGFPPYGGAFDGSAPHLTLAEGALGHAGDLEAVEAAVRPRLPFSQRIDHVLLIAGSQQPRSWHTMHRLDLGDG